MRHMTTLLSYLILVPSVLLILYLVVSKLKKPIPLYSLNIFGALVVGPAAVMATAAQEVNSSTSQMTNFLFLWLCITGISLALVCVAVGFVMVRMGKETSALIVLKLPLVYAGLWFVGFFILGT